jgi:hypothetical protein
MAFDGSVQRVWEALERRVPIAQWEIVRVTFSAADTDTDIPHALVPPTAEHIEYVPIRKSGAGDVYQDMSATRVPWQNTFIYLRCTALITVDLLLFVVPGTPRTVIS